MKDPSERLVLLYCRDQIARRVRELAENISTNYAASDLVLIGILRGDFVFLADLIRQFLIISFRVLRNSAGEFPKTNMAMAGI